MTDFPNSILYNERYRSFDYPFRMQRKLHADVDIKIVVPNLLIKRSPRC